MMKLFQYKVGLKTIYSGFFHDLEEARGYALQFFGAIPEVSFKPELEEWFKFKNKSVKVCTHEGEVAIENFSNLVREGCKSFEGVLRYRDEILKSHNRDGKIFIGQYDTLNKSGIVKTLGENKIDNYRLEPDGTVSLFCSEEDALMLSFQNNHIFVEDDRKNLLKRAIEGLF